MYAHVLNHLLKSYAVPDCAFVMSSEDGPSELRLGPRPGQPRLPILRHCRSDADVGDILARIPAGRSPAPRMHRPAAHPDVENHPVSAKRGRRVACHGSHPVALPCKPLRCLPLTITAPSKRTARCRRIWRWLPVAPTRRTPGLVGMRPPLRGSCLTAAPCMVETARPQRGWGPPGRNSSRTPGRPSRSGQPRRGILA